jgi:hypothetical protein
MPNILCHPETETRRYRGTLNIYIHSYSVSQYCPAYREAYSSTQ